MDGRIATLVGALALAVAATACGSGTTTSSDHGEVAVRPARVAVNSTVAPAPMPATVAVHRPDLRADDVRLDLDVRDVLAIDGVEHAALGATLPLQASTSDGLVTVEAFVVDPHAFRPLTPDTTAGEPGVWERLQDGNAVFTAAAANRTGAILGETLALSGPRATEALRVGALAVNGIPQVADLLLDWPTGRRLGADGPTSVIVALSEDADLDAVRARVAEIAGAEPTIIEEPEQQAARTTEVGRSTLESFTYQSLGDGTIRIDPGWVSRNIVTVDLPLLGQVRCHRVMIEQLAAALDQIQRAGLGHLITDFAGCYVPRHMLWDPARPISKHAWGLAFDINVPTNGYGAAPQLDPRIVEIFTSWGFEWGGNWSTPDGMHFELDRIVRPA